MTRKRLGGTSMDRKDSKKKKDEDTRKHRTSTMYRWRGTAMSHVAECRLI